MANDPDTNVTDDERASAADLRQRANAQLKTRQEHLDRAAELNKAATALNRAADLIDGGQPELPLTDGEAQVALVDAPAAQ